MILGNNVPLGVFHILAGLLNDSGHRQDVILGEDVVLCTDIDRLAEGFRRCLPLQMEQEVATVTPYFRFMNNVWMKASNSGDFSSRARLQ